MTEPTFKRPELEDKEIISSYFEKAQSRSCERTFVNVYLWSRHYKVQYAIIEDTLVFRDSGKNLSFTYPAGEPENVKKALEFLMEYCKEKDVPFILYNVTPHMFAQLDKWYPKKFFIEYNEIWQIMCMRRRNLLLWQEKSFMGSGIISINSRLFIRIGAMSR